MRFAHVAATLLTVVVSCGRADRAVGRVAEANRSSAAVRSTGGSTEAQPLLATAPASDCDWIPLADEIGRAHV